MAKSEVKNGTREVQELLVETAKELGGIRSRVLNARERLPEYPREELIGRTPMSVACRLDGDIETLAGELAKLGTSMTISAVVSSALLHRDWVTERAASARADAYAELGRLQRALNEPTTTPAAAAAELQAGAKRLVELAGGLRQRGRS